MLAANTNAPALRDRQPEYLELAYRLLSLGSFFAAHGGNVECLALNDAYGEENIAATERKLALAYDDLGALLSDVRGMRDV